MADINKPVVETSKSLHPGSSIEDAKAVGDDAFAGEVSSDNASGQNDSE